mgnify:CR=1 FL=1
MSLARVIRSAMIRRFADPVRREQRHERAEAARQKAGRPHEVLYFHQVDDPYSQLAVQAVAPLLERFEIQIEEAAATLRRCHAAMRAENTLRS